MKKIFLSTFVCALTVAFVSICEVNAATYNIVPKAPAISNVMKPAVAKYRQGNYVGAMQDLEELVKKDKNNTYAKYYLALCYTRLGFKEEAQTLYKEVIAKDYNLTLSYYSQRALDCLDNPENEICQPPKPSEEKQEELDDITQFIKSGRQIHPSAMDKITRERMERKLQQEEYLRNQQEAQQDNTQFKSDAAIPTNEEIAAALNTLSKIGMNPFQPYNNMMSTPYAAYSGNNTNADIARMFLYSQMPANSNSIFSYGL